MHYTASIRDFFKSPKWPMNMLLGGVCVLIPIVGQIAVMGWLIIGFWGRDNEPFENFPAFDFNNFGKYLDRGIWPFLVVLVGTLATMPIFFVLVVPLIVLETFITGPDGSNNEVVAAIIGIAIFLLYLLMMLTVVLIMTPLKVRASLVQEFGKSFSFSFTKRFVALTWKESILMWLFMMVTSIGFMIAGFLAFCVGVYFITVPIYFAWTHLSKQLYALYLSRGGEPVMRSPKLSEGPPPLPAV